MPIRIPFNVELRLAELAREHPDWGAKRHAKALADEFPDTAPSERTVSDRLAKLRDTSGRWTLRPSERDASFLLDVLATMPGPLPTLTQDEADWLRTLHAAAPWLEASDSLRMARLYLAASGLEKAGWLTHALDLALAYRTVPTGDPAKWGLAFYGSTKGS